METLRSESDQLAREAVETKKEIQSLKKVKDKLFLEIQRLKVPIKSGKMMEQDTQTEVFLNEDDAFQL